MDCNGKVVNLYIDNGREYLSNEMRDYCVQKGISYHLTVPHTPQLNGVSERMIRTITEKARAMVNGAQLDKSYWGEAVLTATFLINRTPSKALKDSSKKPYEMWHKRKPNLKYLKVFGSTVYVHNKTKKRKFDEKSWKGILVGYEPNGYKLWDVEAEKFTIARDVIVDETNMKNFRTVLDVGSQLNDFPFGNESTRNIDLNYLNESKERKSDEPQDKQPSDVVISKENADPVGTGETVSEYEDTGGHNNQLRNSKLSEGMSEIEVRRSDRLKDRPQRTYTDDSYLYSCVMNADTCVSATPNSFEEIKTRSDRSHWSQMQ